MPTLPTPDTDQPNTGQETARWGRIPAWWLSHPDIDADGLAVLAALSTYANVRGECWPSQATLATALKRSRSTVNRILGHLADAAVIEVEPRKSANGGRLSCLYRLRLDPGSGPIVNASAMPVRQRDTAVAVTDSPCVTARQEQPDSNKPDSLAGRGREGVNAERVEDYPLREPQAVPANWMPSAADLAWARAKHTDIDIDRHVEGFVLRCQAHGYRYRDVGAAWRSWLLQDVQAHKAPLVSGTPTVSGTSRMTDKAAAARQQVDIWAGVADCLRQRPSAETSAISFGGGW
ncbi:helix-turn-helix domain-containing protein [Azospirillum cavernae]|nr:helix-turn-helix domain-containing protein [Azospirillum cavernae]